ncbi:two-component sensor histidine kinase [Herbidospora sp. NEAU-GS84]|uniref:histidine kinase n=1 Tax=Herbidospora solisilvae TaxID=2696284 RepID=A0A7C9JC74_9ACTN|nr:histidine kinase [Herbidospora solisilvae]NAS22641.1 two-component sensor histidine kinase [Herbidospora solisilvae]
MRTRITRPVDGRLIAAITGGAGVVSLTVTAVTVATGGQNDASGWTVAESGCLLSLIIVAVRAAPTRAALTAAALAGLATPSLLLRYGLGTPTPEAVAGFAVWALSAALAATVGLYLRSLDDRRTRSVLDARRAQRTELARDLHDFVAHDISGMLAQAQAGRVLAQHDPRRAAALFERIEQTALQALASMDRTVRMLDDSADRTPLPSLADLRDLCDRFSGATTVHLDIGPRLDDPAREAAATAYRVVVEALTNVRRHAPTASHVKVTVTDVPGPALRVTVTDDGPGGTRRGGGSGLPGLTERVEALGGTLTAGPHPPRGWRVEATMPSVTT